MNANLNQIEHHLTGANGMLSDFIDKLDSAHAAACHSQPELDALLIDMIRHAEEMHGLLGRLNSALQTKQGA